MVTTRHASAADTERVAAFYRAYGYQRTLDSTDVVVIAEQDGELCGALRLCEEHKHLVLRGMRVAGSMRRRGIGTRLLEAAERFIGGRTCFCIPLRHLQPFYGRAGFVAIDEDQAPPLLRDRCARYRHEYALDVIIMYRPGGTEVSQVSWKKPGVMLQ
jgi:N-acetylglutamate synthase-like GNAT family acetyltransferase